LAPGLNTKEGLLGDDRMLHREDNACEKDQREFLHDCSKGA
jgi:hypothetical protein